MATTSICGGPAAQRRKHAPATLAGKCGQSCLHDAQGPSDAIEELTGTFVRNTISVGEPIREQNLVQRRGSYFATVLPSGKRAVAVRVSAETTAGGFILPNDRVDVLHTETDHDNQISRTVLKNIRILAVDQIVDEGSKNDKNSKPTVIGKTATLELNSEQAEIIMAAQAKVSCRCRCAQPRTTMTRNWAVRPVRIIPRR